jgi:hypothetical protein
MADRDESGDVARLNDDGAVYFEPWGAVADDGSWTRYVPHSDLEAAEKEIANLKWQLSMATDRTKELIESRERLLDCAREAMRSLGAATKEGGR